MFNFKNSKTNKFIDYLNEILSVENAAVERLYTRIHETPIKDSKKILGEHLQEEKEQQKKDSNIMEESSPVPREIDTHFKLYGKHSWEVKYSGKCEICNSTFDEFGFCACGSMND